jgi:hypothetical protein
MSGDGVQVQIDAAGAVVVIEDVTEAVKDLEQVQVPPSLLQRIPANVRKALYVAGVIVGAIGTIAPAMASLLTGDAQLLVVSVGALALALNSLLARANVSTP